jgi:hypothetical protein
MYENNIKDVMKRLRVQTILLACIFREIHLADEIFVEII